MDILPARAKVIVGFYLLVVVYWAVMYFGDFRDTQISYFYQFVFGLIPIVGAIFGLVTADKWGGLSSKLGRSLFFIALGLLSWGLGQMVWSYYAIFGIEEIPYPSFADLGYVLAVPFWLIGMVNLSKTTGARFGLKKTASKFLVVLLPLTIIAISYYLLIVVARGGALFPEIGTSLTFAKVILDITYPMGDVFILTASLLVFGLSAGYLGGRYKYPIYALLSGFVVMYFADFSFSYTTNAGTYYNGHWVDLLFPTAMALLAFGVTAINPPTAKQPQPVTPVPEPQPVQAEEQQPQSQPLPPQPQSQPQAYPPQQPPTSPIPEAPKDDRFHG